MNPLLTFWGWDYKTPGGMQTVIITLAKHANRINEQIRLFGITDSFLVKALIQEKISFIFYDILIDSEKIKQDLKTEDTVIITSIDQYPKELAKYNPKVLFWLVYKYTIRDRNSIGRYHIRYFSKRFTQLAIKRNALCFMDLVCASEVLSYYHFMNLVDKYVPVPILIPEIPNQPITKGRKKDKIQITYIGRAVDWKVYPVMRLIKDLEDHNIYVKAFIITDYECDFKKYFVNFKSKCVQIEYVQNISGRLLHEFLLANSDLHFSMGTAALEGGALGIPTVLLDGAVKEINNNYRYRWLYESKGFSLGDMITSQTKISGYEINEIFEQVFGSKELNNSIRNLTKNYVQSNHGVNRSYQELVNHSMKTTIRYLDIYNSFLQTKVVYKQFIYPISLILKQLFKSNFYK
jgi:hypothetical protein